MASKWKYADTDAETRLEMLRQGNKELFEEEVARTKSVTEARRELGLDTTEQEKWMDTVGYNYNLSNAQNAGESLGNVSKTGYADIYLGAGSEGKQKRNKAQESNSDYPYTAIDDAIGIVNQALKRVQESINKKYLNLIDSAEDDLYEKSSYYREALVNKGASLEGGKAKKLEEIINQEVDSLRDKYRKSLSEELEKANEKYQLIKDKIYSAISSGKSENSALALAKRLIAEVSENDGYDASDLTKYTSRKRTASDDGDSKVLSDTADNKNNTGTLSENILKILKMIQNTDEVKTADNVSGTELPETETKTENGKNNSDVYTDNTSTFEKVKQSISDGISSEDIKLALKYLGLAGSTSATEKLIKLLTQNYKKIAQ